MALSAQAWQRMKAVLEVKLAQALVVCQLVLEDNYFEKMGVQDRRNVCKHEPATVVGGAEDEEGAVKKQSESEQETKKAKKEARSTY
jgi:hypothetical protein